MKSVVAILATSIMMLLTSAPMHAAASGWVCLASGSKAYCINPISGAPKTPNVSLPPSGGYPTFTCPTDMMALCCPSLPPDLKQCNSATNWG